MALFDHCRVPPPSSVNVCEGGAAGFSYIFLLTGGGPRGFRKGCRGSLEWQGEFVDLSLHPLQKNTKVGFIDFAPYQASQQMGLAFVTFAPMLSSKRLDDRGWEGRKEGT